MSTIRIYHNPNFLDYQGDHAAIVLPDAPIATVTVAETSAPDHALAHSFAATQHLERPWWENPDICLHVRSTSVGDVLETADGYRFVVEAAGFQPYDAPDGQARRPYDVPVAWEEARPGDLSTGSRQALVGRLDHAFLVIARKLDRKWRARRLARCVPGAELWLDGPRHWAVLLPVERG
jgi:hypothetical protein